jgi:hypothetical protein
LVLIGSAEALAATSHVTAFKTQDVSCYFESVSPDLACAAAGIPRPKLKYQIGAANVSLKPTGRASVFDNGNGYSAVELKPGSKWERSGIECTIGQPYVTCTNTDHHGFTIGGGRYKTF